MKLSLLELSKYLGVAPKTIERWVVQGRLPVSQKGTDYQFRFKELEKWALKNKIKLNFSEKNGIQKTKEVYIPLSTAVKSGGVHFKIQGNDINSVLKACLETNNQIANDFKIDLFDRLMAREKALSTGIGNGIAIPHPREPLPYLNHPMVSIYFLDSPIDYRAVDNQPVSILFLILCPTLNMHLHLLSVLSFCLRDKQFVSMLKSEPDADIMLKEIKALENANPV